MQIIESEFHRKCAIALAKALEKQQLEDWNAIIKENSTSYFDGFLILSSYPHLTNWLSKLGFSGIDDWLLQADKWHIDVLDASSDSTSDVIVLISLWINLKEQLQELLRKARLNADIPNRGGALVYVDGISKCLVVNYEFSDTGASKLNDTSKPNIEVIQIINDPKSAFDFWGIVTHQGMLGKNKLKELLSTGHKIIIHRDVLIHVDRRKDVNVFGPSIDTLLLSEILGQTLYEAKSFNCRSALEVGCGNGLLTVSIAKNCQTLAEIYAYDINFEALNCTNRNLNGVLPPIKQNKLIKYLISGPFDGTVLSRKFDLIVCNPPYIPLPPTNKTGSQTANFYQAVGGLTVIDELLSTLPKTLEANGRLLLLVSSLTLDYTISKVPEGYHYDLILRSEFEVPFDVEAVLSKEEWLSYLLAECKLREKAGSYYHSLHPMWIYKK